MCCGCCLCCCPSRRKASSNTTFANSCLHPNGNAKMSPKSHYDDDPDVLNLSDKNIESFNKINYIFNLTNLRVLVLSNNKLKSVPYEIDKLVNLERLNLFNNFISDLPSSICNLTNLRYLNVGMNNLNMLPPGFNKLSQLEVLDLSYNFFDENSFSPEFFTLENLRALYLSDNELETLPAAFGNFKNLLILALRDNNLISLPSEIGGLSRLRELIIQHNRLRMLPPELVNMDLNSQRSALRMDGNPLDNDLADQLKIGISHVLDYIRSDYYRSRYVRNLMEMSTISPQPKNEERKNRKLLRLKGK